MGCGNCLSVLKGTIEDPIAYYDQYAKQQKMRRVYRGLAKIEDSFKITKTFFESRPVYVRTNDHIDAHFATCFLALVLERLLEHKLDHKYPTGQIIASIRKYNCTHLDTNNWQFTYYDKLIDACGKALDMDLKKVQNTAGNTKTSPVLIMCLYSLS